MEEITVTAGKLKATLKALVREGNVRRVVIRNTQGRTLLDMPLTAGLAGALFAPFWLAVAGIVALAKEFTIAVERDPGTAVTKPD
jgi:integral membrane sensor domain MASE1